MAKFPPMGSDESKALIQKAFEDCEKCNKLTTEELLDLLPEPGDIDQQAMLLALFQRDALYKTIERYPESKEDIIHYYNGWCRMMQVYRSLGTEKK